MAFPVTLNGRTYTLADFEGTNYVDGLPDAFEDFVTHAGAIYKTTSTTSNTIGTGSKSFTTADNSLPYQVGTPLRISDGAAPATNWMDGVVTAYSGTSLTVNVLGYAGSGTKTDWDINIGGGPNTVSGTLPVAQGGTGATTAGAAATNLGLGTGDSPSFSGLTVDTDTLYVDSANNRVGIGTTSPSHNLHVSSSGGSTLALTAGSTENAQVRFGDSSDDDAGKINYDNSTNHMAFHTNAAERLRVDSSGNVLVGQSSSTSVGAGNTTTGFSIRNDGGLYVSRTSGNVATFNRNTSDGTITEYRKDGSVVGSIGNSGAYMYLASQGPSSRGVKITDNFIPADTSGNNNDNAMDLGGASVRWDDVYATNGTIQTSDINEKQDIAELDEAEKRVATAAKGLIRKFRWKDSVAEKGDDARIHVGVIAQDLVVAFMAEGLDPCRYGMFISSTWWEADETYTDDEGVEQTRTNTYETAAEAPVGAVERTRLGVRYNQLLAFIISAL